MHDELLSPNVDTSPDVTLAREIIRDLTHGRASLHAKLAREEPRESSALCSAMLLTSHKPSLLSTTPRVRRAHKFQHLTPRMSLGSDATSELAKAEVEEHGKILKGGPAATAQVFRQLPRLRALVRFPVFAGPACGAISRWCCWAASLGSPLFSRKAPTRKAVDSSISSFQAS